MCKTPGRKVGGEYRPLVIARYWLSLLVTRVHSSIAEQIAHNDPVTGANPVGPTIKHKEVESMVETEKITNAKQLYEVDSDFRALINAWVIDRRIPYCLHDYLLERGLSSQADCAKWAIDLPDRTTFKVPGYNTDFPEKMPLYPTLNSGEPYYYFLIVGAGWNDIHDYVPVTNLKKEITKVKGNSIPECIIALLDAWE